MTHVPIDLRRAQPTRPGALGTLFVLLGLVFVIVSALVAAEWGSLLDIDTSVAQSAYDVSADRPGLIVFLEWIAFWMGPNAIRIFLAVVAGFLWWRRETGLALWVVATGVVEAILAPVAKLVFDRDRPTWPIPLAEIGTPSFPSGHATAAGLLATTAILLTIVLTGRGLKRRIIIAGWVILALLIGADRIFLGVHYLSDVVGGLALGSSIPLLMWVLFIRRSIRLPHPLAGITGTGGKRAAVVYNPIKVGDPDVFKTRVRGVAEREGWGEPLWFETTLEDPGVGQAHAALEAEVDLVVAAGGDGTVRVVCHELARTGTAVGILPHGTGNLLARNVGIPLNVKDALDVVFGGQDRAIDLVSYSSDAQRDTSFLVMAGLGMDAAIMDGAPDELKKKVGWLAYFISGVKSLSFPATKVQISVDGGEFKKFRARTVVIGNVGFLQAGLPLLPEAEIDDGVLDVVVLAPKRLLGWLAIVVRVISRQKRTNERLGRMTGRKVVVRAEKPTPMQLDGDSIGDGTEMTVEVQPGVLLVRVPLAPEPRRS